MRLGDQHAGGVRPDIDAAAEHARGSDVAMMEPMTSGVSAIEVTGLSKAYGSQHALRGVDFTVARGEVFGLLGPNGAGKTTCVEVLEGYRARDAGEVRVLGHDPGDRPAELRARVGIVLQSCGTYPHLTVRETVEHWASLYPAPRRVDEVLALAGLDDCAARRARTLSGGQARRLDFALALVGDPELIFLDEPTTGFDPAARRAAWDVVRALRDLGKTVVLTTHYLDEAQALADRVAILQDGLILAEGPPDALGASRYRVAWRAADGTLEERFTEDPTALLRDADRRGAGARRAAGGPERDAPEPRGRVPRADRGHRLIAAAWRQYPPRTADVLAQPERGVLRRPPAARAARDLRRRVRRPRGGPRRDRARHRRPEHHVGDVHVARLQPHDAARARDPQAAARDAAADLGLPRPGWPATRSPTPRCSS